MIEPFKFLKNFIAQLNERGGPVEADYFELDRWIALAYHHGPTQEEVEEIFGNEILDKNSPSLLNRIFYRPRGYAGSFDIMEDIYQDNISPTIPQLQMTWDAYILSQISCVAAKHRLQVLKQIGVDSRKESLRFLDVACGSGIAHPILLQARRSGGMHYRGVDQDPEAIEHCQKYIARNDDEFKVLPLSKLSSKQFGTFDIVWCSGLFDYVKGRGAFVAAARRLVRLADKVAVIGNMGPYNPSRPSMSLLGWNLEYRTRAELDYMGSEIQKKDEQVKRTYVRTDPTGIQHYLYIEKR
jgi:SAM-dependent methyltransferase